VITAYTPTVARNAAQALNRSVDVQLNGIDSQLFCSKTPSFIDERVAHAEYRIFTVGRNDPVKNMDTAIKATRLLSERIGSVAHVVAGPGTEHIAFDGVHLGVGSLGEAMIVEYLNWCSCFLQVQLVSDLGIAACEALIVGRPVIVTGDLCGNAETPIDAQKGTLIPIEKAKDANYVAHELQRCLEASYDSSKIRNWAIKVYDAEHLSEKEAERYMRLISARAEMNRSRSLIWDTFMWSLYGGIAMRTLRQKCRDKMK
jgi:glycosyltransferase involved in cell wall biosynthesis